MGDRKLPADIPSNYVTLLELQERWVKEQQRKQREKEEEEKGNEQKLLRRENEEKKERNTQARLLKNGQRNRRWNYRRGNQNSKKSGRHVCPEENEAEIVAAFVEGNEIESAVKETKNKGWGNNWKQKQQKKEKEKMEDGEARGKEEEERKAGQADTPPVKSEGSVSVRRHDRRRDIRLEFRPKITSVVQKRDRTVTIEREVVNVAEGTEDTAVKITGKNENVLEKSEGTVEIEGKLRNLSVEKENERLETQNRIVNRSNSQYRGYNANSRNVECRGYNSGVKHRTGQYYGRFNGQYRGNYGKFNGQYRGNYGRFNGQYRGNYGRFSKGRQDGMVWAKKEQVADNDEGIGVDWMKKEKVADDGEGIGDQSSSNSAAL